MATSSSHAWTPLPSHDRARPSRPCSTPSTCTSSTRRPNKHWCKQLVGSQPFDKSPPLGLRGEGEVFLPRGRRPHPYVRVYDVVVLPRREREVPLEPFPAEDSTSSGSSSGCGRVATAVVGASSGCVAYTLVPQKGHIFQRSVSGRSQRRQV